MAVVRLCYFEEGLLCGPCLVVSERYVSIKKLRVEEMDASHQPALKDADMKKYIKNRVGWNEGSLQVGGVRRGRACQCSTVLHQALMRGHFPQKFRQYTQVTDNHGGR